MAVNTGRHDRLDGGELSDGMARAILDTAVNPFALVAADGTVIWTSASVVELTGHQADDLVGRSVLDLVDPADRGRVLDALTSADARTRAGAPATWEGAAPVVDLATTSGTMVRCQVAVATPARTGLAEFVVQLRRSGGIGWLHEALTAMAEGRDLRTVITHLVAMTELDLPWVRLSVGWDWDGERFLNAEGGPSDLDLTRAWGTTGPWAVPTATGRRLPVTDLPHELAQAALDAGAPEVWLRHLGGNGRRALVAAWHVAPWPMTAFTEVALERAARLVGVALGWDRDRRSLDWAARHDALTGLPNRGSFLADLARNARHAVTVLYLDLDDFKPVNDDHGHAHGDRVLAEVAARLRGSIRPDDVVARLGGDEFAVLCPGLADPEVAERLAQRLMEAVSRPIHLDDVEIQVGLSVGIAGVLEGDHRPDELLTLADHALRQAKAAGKHRWRRAPTPGPTPAPGQQG